MGGVNNQQTDFKPKHEEKQEFILIRYEDISNEARHNARANSTIFTLFITASFTLSAYFFTQNPKNEIGFIFIIIGLFWFAMFYNISWNMANEIVLKLRDNIVKKYDLKVFKEYDKKKRVKPSHTFLPFVIVYHLIFIYYSVINLSLFDTLILLISLVILGVLYKDFLDKEEKLKTYLKSKE